MLLYFMLFSTSELVNVSCFSGTSPCLDMFDLERFGLDVLDLEMIEELLTLLVSSNFYTDLFGI